MKKYSLFLDGSGIIAKEAANHSYYTVGGIIVDTAEVEEARNSISIVGKKWRDIDNSTATKMVRAILDNAMAISVMQIEKMQPMWENFWNEGMQFHSVIASAEKSRIGFLKPSTIIRYDSFRRGSTQAVGYCLRCQGLPKIITPAGYSILDITMICDTDIQGEENADMFYDMCHDYHNRSKLKEKYNLEIKMSNVALKTEQEEPLLLAADFVAGCFQWHLGKSEVPLPKQLDKSCAESIVSEFKRSKTFISDQQGFHLTYEKIFRGKLYSYYKQHSGRQ
ncbi:MAG: hypothetical protein CDV28_104106 [Candidatus Electronema aureum]|uniref:DUF3800 domain-containing protein n=1 Tax=Candidatus Electronema aureum TaxID=2005002 RepID=A0A521G421_9BACT|nr:MAG: hypothetical protein CDV28_104106 [Candidatus Electronema aureum]